MASDLERWFSEPNFGVVGDGCEEDWFVVLAEIEFLPRLQAQLEDTAQPVQKKIEVIHALLLIMEDAGKFGRVPISEVDRIRDTIRRHRVVAERAIPETGHLRELVLRKLLGMPIPDYYTQKDFDEAAERGAP